MMQMLPGLYYTVLGLGLFAWYVDRVLLADLVLGRTGSGKVRNLSLVDELRHHH